MKGKMRFYVVSASVAFAVFAAQAQASDRLIGWWRIEDATNATVLADSSGHGRNATIGTGVEIVEDGRFGRAVRFDGTGDAWARFSNPTLTNLTIAAWVYVDGTPNNTLPRIMQLGANTYFHMPTNTLGQFTLGVENNDWSTNVQDPFKFKTNTWFHAAVVHRLEYTNATAAVVWPTFYINGVRSGDPLAQKAFLAAVPAGGSAFFGNNNAGSGGIRPLKGLMDDVRLYDAALSDKDILEVYQNSPLSVDAGEDQNLYRDTTALQGRLISTNPFMRNLSSQTSWSTVSAPAGDAPVIRTPWLPVTTVALPAAGAYTFRLTAVTELGTVSNDVTITRNISAPPAGNAAPVVTPLATSINSVLGSGAILAATVADDEIPGATRLCWSKVSGPGAVFFDNAFTSNTAAFFSTNGTYILRLAADDGALQGNADITVTVALPSGDISQGLEHWWQMNDDPVLKKAFDSASGNTLSLNNLGFLQPGKTGSGYRGPKLDAVGVAASLPTNAATMTFTAWLYYDGAYIPPVAGNRYQRLYNCGPNFYILYDPISKQLSLSTRSGSTGDTQYTWAWSTSLKAHQWFHISVLFDRRAAASGSRQIMYINGEKFLSGTLNTAFPGAAAFTSPFIVGNTAATNGTRNFDGVLDEMRLYSRFITDEEALLLAVDPDNNHAPVIEVPAVRRVKVGQPTTLQGVVTDDGQPFGSTLINRWSVISGDPDHVIFADASDPATDATFTRTGEYEIMLSATDGEQQAATIVKIDAVASGTVILVH